MLTYKVIETVEGKITNVDEFPVTIDGLQEFVQETAEKHFLNKINQRLETPLTEFETDVVLFDAAFNHGNFSIRIELN